MMTDINDRIGAYHSDLIRKWGAADCRAIGYSGRRAQTARFGIIAQFHDNGGSILDVGCGTGDLYRYISAQSGEFDYTGIDLQAEFIAHAKAAPGKSRRPVFLKGDYLDMDLPECDLVVACGVFNYRRDSVQPYLDSISHLYAIAGKALVFNMLDVARMLPTEAIVGHEPDTILAHCRGLSDHVTLIRGYLSYDFMVAVEKQPCSEPRIDRLRRIPDLEVSCRT